MDASSPAEMNDEFVRAAFERCPSGLLAVDGTGRIVVVNREVERVFGYTREELLGQSVEMLVPGNFASGHAKLRAQFSAEPHARPMGAGRDLFGLHKDGHQIPVEIGLSSVATPGGRLVLVTVVDISTRRHLEQRMHQVHKLEALGTLASGVAHDFNNFLVGIVGYTELARNSVPGMTSTIADLDVVIETARRAQHMVNRILLFSHASEPVRAKTRFEAPVREAIQLLRAGLPSNIEIREFIDSDTPQVLADGTRRNGEHVLVTVSDTGSGIPENIRDKVFDPFFTTKPVGQGTGQGLAIARSVVVDKHHGTLILESEAGKGTTFFVRWPIAAPPETDGIVEEEPA